MSKFLLSKIGVMVPAGQTRVATRDAFKTWFQDAGWQVIHTEDTTPSLTVLPPSSEATGNARGKEVLRLLFNPTDITFRPLYLVNETSYAAYYLTSNSTSGSTSVKIGTVTFSVSNTGTTTGNTQALYNALAASSAPEATAYTFTLADVGDGVQRVIATEKIAGTGLAVTGVWNCQVNQRSLATLPGTIVDRGPYLNENAYTVSVDYGQGWVLYAGWHARSFILATRTMAGFYGPVGGTFIPNSDALAQAPSSNVPLVELLCGKFDSATGSKFGYALNYGYSSTNNMLASQCSSSTSTARPLDGATYHPYSPPVADTFVSRVNGAEALPTYSVGGISAESYNNTNAKLFGTNGITMGTVLVHSASNRSSNASYTFSSLWVPAVTANDFNVYLTGDTSETAHVVRQSAQTVLVSAIDASATSLRVTDPALFNPTGGTLVIGSEVITYSGLSDATLTGLTRGYNGTAAAAHTVTETVYVGFWYLKINAGAVPTGYAPPA